MTVLSFKNCADYVIKQLSNCLFQEVMIYRTTGLWDLVETEMKKCMARAGARQ